MQWEKGLPETEPFNEDLGRTRKNRTKVEHSTIKEQVGKRQRKTRGGWEEVRGGGGAS